VLDSGFAHTVLAVITDQDTMECLDTQCTLAGPDVVVMRPSVAYSLVARTITQRCGGLRLSHPRPFLEAAADAMGLDRLRVVETGLGPDRAGPHPGLGGPVSQWDDAGNLLVIGPGTVVSYERNTLTNTRLEAAGINVIGVPGGELSGCRGGPRAICCPVGREPAAMPEPVALADRARPLPAWLAFQPTGRYGSSRGAESFKSVSG
jgi:arginine deiminase